MASSRRPIYFNRNAFQERCNAPTVDGLDKFHQTLPNYCPTPLVPLPQLAEELGVRAVFVKDESNRFGLPSFKVLGASWGCFRAVAARVGLPSTVGLDQLSAKAKSVPISLFAATKGNHGRAVAFVARLLSLEAHIFVPKSMGDTTRSFLSDEGARLIVVDGDYDQAVQECTAAAAIEGGVLVQDTAFEGYEEIPAWIVEGYSTMMNEIEAQLGELGLQSSLMITPAGVGSLSHAVVMHCKSRSNLNTVMAVESDSAPCLYSSLRSGTPVSVRTTSTIMDGMNCGTVSLSAWPDLERMVDVCATVSSHESHSAVQYLASQSVAAGPCGGASLAALRRLSSSKDAASILSKDSVVVCLSTEGSRDYPVPIDVSADDAVSLTQVLTRIDSSNPTLSVEDGAGESRIVDYLEAWFAHRGVEHHRVETTRGRPSIVGVMRGTGGGKSLMFNGHIDTVSLTSYEKDPLSGTLGDKDGRLVVFGRGSLDMKSGLAAALTSLSATIASDSIPRGDVVVTAVADEEDESRGTQDILAARWRADAAIIPEPTMGAIMTSHKGFVWVEVDILGVAAHGSLPEEGQDAIFHAAWFLGALEEYQKHLPADEFVGEASLHCGLIRGGQEPSSYPATCTITIEFRTVPGQTPDSILQDMKTLLATVAKDKPQFRYTEPQITLSRPTQKLPTEHPLVQKIAEIATSILGSRPSISSASFWCDAALLSEAGIPSIVFGPKGEGLHAKEEWVDVESLKQMEEVYTKAIQELCQ